MAAMMATPAFDVEVAPRRPSIRRYGGRRYCVPDRGLERFGLETCRIYEELTGKVTYATSTKPGAHRPAEKRSSHGLDVVLAVLRMIDPNTTVSQAQRVIDLRRGWRQQGTKPRVAIQRM